jgi:hypothetical protein
MKNLSYRTRTLADLPAQIFHSEHPRGSGRWHAKRDSSQTAPRYAFGIMAERFFTPQRLPLCSSAARLCECPCS